ncbi:hypothetical protein JYB88_18315 [Shewanella cyperi]|uniref:Permease n=1 Tax=Shewanella cyperi TaxID=2814292 RepID=A0A974XKJ5_9GAMM|nr:hypothetical protein [Shewanella cyperi]QSX30096.1 hypothetical protein JYB88_18315 [Shewanella cyperi]
MSPQLKSDLTNILLLAVLLLGLVAALDTGWGFLIAGLPVVIWSLKILTFIHRRLWLAIPLWCGLAFLYWQVALALFTAYLFVTLYHQVKEIRHSSLTPSRQKRKMRKEHSFQNSYDFDYRKHIGTDDESI